MKRTKPQWTFEAGMLAAYLGSTARLLRRGSVVLVVAEASGGRVVVEAIGHQGKAVRFTVAAKHLGQPQPGLFDGYSG